MDVTHSLRLELIQRDRCHALYSKKENLYFCENILKVYRNDSKMYFAHIMGHCIVLPMHRIALAIAIAIVMAGSPGELGDNQ